LDFYFFFRLSIHEDTLLVEKYIWYIKIGIVKVWHLGNSRLQNSHRDEESLGFLSFTIQGSFIVGPSIYRSNIVDCFLCFNVLCKKILKCPLNMSTLSVFHVKEVFFLSIYTMVLTRYASLRCIIEHSYILQCQLTSRKFVFESIYSISH
jgi:hypothetical protein